MLYKHKLYSCILQLCMFHKLFGCTGESVCASEEDVSVIYVRFGLLVYWFQGSIFECDCYNIWNTYVVYGCFVAGSMYII